MSTSEVLAIIGINIITIGMLWMLIRWINKKNFNTVCAVLQRELSKRDERLSTFIVNATQTYAARIWVEDNFKARHGEAAQVTPIKTGTMSEVSIKELMRDPRYWRDRDPVIIEKVQNGFERLFPDKDSGL